MVFLINFNSERLTLFYLSKNSELGGHGGSHLLFQHSGKLRQKGHKFELSSNLGNSVTLQDMASKQKITKR